MGNSMEKRYCLRLPTSIDIKYYSGRDEHRGVITNISLNGMCIKTDIQCPPDEELEVVIPAYNEEIKVPAKVHRPEEDDRECMGLEVTESPEGYVRFVDTLFFYYSIV